MATVSLHCALLIYYYYYYDYAVMDLGATHETPDDCLNIHPFLQGSNALLEWHGTPKRTATVANGLPK